MHLLLIRHGQSENNAFAAQSVETYQQGRKPDLSSPSLTTSSSGPREVDRIGLSSANEAVCLPHDAYHPDG